ncbi:MAG: Cyclolysin, partial [Planctomycetota bacterium]
EILFNGDSGDDVFQNAASSIGGLVFNGGADDDVLQNSGASLDGLIFSGDSGDDALYNSGASVVDLVFTGGADDDILVNTGAMLAGLVFNGDSGDDVFVNTGALIAGLTFTGGADDDILQNTGSGVTDLVFSGDAGNDRFWNRSTAANSSRLTFSGDSGDDVLVNEAGGITDLVFTGGADDDALQNSGVNISGLRFEGGADDDVFVNTSAGAILSLNFGGDDGIDILQNSGNITSLIFGGGADDDVLVNWGTVDSLNFMGDGELTVSGELQQIAVGSDDGSETLANYGSIGVLVFSGGADDDILVNSGPVTSLTFSGGADDDVLQNNTVVTDLVFSGNADDDILINNGNDIGSLVFNGDDGIDSLIINGSNLALLVFTGGADADSLRIHGSGHGQITFTGGDDAAADTFNYSGVGAAGSSVIFTGGPGNDILGWRGSADSLLFSAGAGDDISVIVGSGSLTLDGGPGDDIVYIQGNPSATVTITESGGASDDTSSDTLNFSSFSGGAIDIDLRSTSSQAQSSAFSLSLSNSLGIENVVGTAGADVIKGNARSNRIFGAQYSDGYGAAGGGSRGITQWVLFDFDSRTDLAAGEHEYTPDERLLIAERVEQIYRGPDSDNPWFDVRVALDVSEIPGGVTEYATVYFNDTPAFGRPGGLASEIDPGNLSFSGTAVVQVNGLLGGVITEADLAGEGGDSGGDKGSHPFFRDEQVGAQKPAATSENFVLLSAKIAAHELAHLMGLRHNDSFGPIGFGVHDPPGVDGYNPLFPGPAGAVETFDHLLGTGASVGSDRFNDLRDLFFGEREAIKLSLAVSDHDQTVITESSVAHGTAATAQTLPLVTVAVPNTLGSGLNDGKVLHVQLISVLGEISVDSSTGQSESDWYSFVGTAGDILNLDLYSNSLTRYGTSADDYIDSIVRIWYVNGGVLTLVPWFTSTAVNDDIFEPTDSSITDLLLPVSGTYYIEVDTFARDPGSPVFDVTNPTSPINPDNPSNILGYPDLLKRFVDTRDDTDVGHYQLVVSRFAAASDGDGTDTIVGFGGTDEIDAGAGDDYSLQVTVGGDSAVTAGNVFTRSVSVVDRAASDWTGSTVNFGDGSDTQELTVSADGTALLSHTYTQNGTYTVTVTIVDDIGQTLSRTFGVTVTGATPGTYNVRIGGNDPSSGYDQSDITGSVNLGGAALNLDFTTFSDTVSDGGIYLIVRNDGDDAIIGRFGGLEDGSVVSTDFAGSGKTARISYYAGDGNDLALIVEDSDVAFNIADAGLGAGAADVGLRIIEGTVQWLVNSTVRGVMPLGGLNSVALNGRSGTNDALHLDFSGANSALLLELDSVSINLGGDSSDDLIIDAGGNQVAVSHGSVGAGNLTIGGLALQFAGLGLNTLYVENAAVLTLSFDSSVSSVSFDDHGTPGQSTVSGTGFTTTQLQNPSQGLIINLGASGTLLTFNSMDAAFNPADGITINGGAGADSILITSPGSSFSQELVVLGNGGVDSVGISGTLAVASLNLQVESTTLSGVNVTTSGSMTFGGNVLLDTAAVTLNTNGGTLLISGGLSGQQDLTLASGIGSAAVTVSGAVADLGDGTGASLTVNSGVTGLIWFQGAFSGNSGIAALGAGSSLRFDGDVTLANGSTGTNLAGSVQLDGLTFSGFDGLSFGATTLSGAAVMINSNSSSLLFTGALNGGQDLQLTAGTGSIDFDGDVGATARLGAVTINSALNMTADGVLRAASLVQSAGTGTSTFTGAVNTNGSAGVSITTVNLIISSGITTTGSGGVQISVSGVSPDGVSVIANGAVINSDGPISIAASTRLSVGGNLLTTNDAITITATAVLTADVLVDSGMVGNTISFSSTVDGTGANAQGLTLDAGTAGVVSIAGAIGKSVSLRTLTLVSSNGAVFGANDSDSLVAGTSVQIQSSQSGSAVVFHGAVVTPQFSASAGPYSLTLAGSGTSIGDSSGPDTLKASILNAGVVTLGNAGTDTLLFRNGLNIVNAANIRLFAQISTQGAAVTLGDGNTAVRLQTATAMLDVTNSGALPTGAAITFGGAVDGNSGSENISLNAGSQGDIVFSGSVGALQPVGVVEIVRARNVSLQAFDGGRFYQQTGTGTTTLNSTVETSTGLSTDVGDINAGVPVPTLSGSLGVRNVNLGVDITNVNIAVNSSITTVLGGVRLRATAGASGVVTLNNEGSIASDFDVVLEGSATGVPAIVVHALGNSRLGMPGEDVLVGTRRRFLTVTSADVEFRGDLSLLATPAQHGDIFFIDSGSGAGHITFTGKVDVNLSDLDVRSGSGNINFRGDVSEAHRLFIQDAGDGTLSGGAPTTVTFAGNLSTERLITAAGDYHVDLLGSVSVLGLNQLQYYLPNDTVFLNSGRVTLGNDTNDRVSVLYGLSTAAASVTHMAGLVEAMTAISLSPVMLTPAGMDTSLRNTTVQPIRIAADGSGRSVTQAGGNSLILGTSVSRSPYFFAGGVSVETLTTIASSSPWDLAILGSLVIADTGNTSFNNRGLIQVGSSSAQTHSIGGGLGVVTNTRMTLGGSLTAAGNVNIPVPLSLIGSGTALLAASPGSIVLGDVSLGDGVDLTIGSATTSSISAGGIEGTLSGVSSTLAFR